MDFDQILEQDDVEWMRENSFPCSHTISMKIASFGAMKCLQYAYEMEEVPEDINLELIRSGQPYFKPYRHDGELELIMRTKQYSYLKIMNLPDIEIAYKLVVSGSLTERQMKRIYKLYSKEQWNELVRNDRVWKLYKVGAIFMVKDAMMSPFLFTQRSVEAVRSVLKRVKRPVCCFLHRDEKRLRLLMRQKGVLVRNSRKRQTRENETMVIRV